MASWLNHGTQCKVLTQAETKWWWWCVWPFTQKSSCAKPQLVQSSLPFLRGKNQCTGLPALMGKGGACTQESQHIFFLQGKSTFLSNSLASYMLRSIAVIHNISRVNQDIFSCISCFLFSFSFLVLPTHWATNGERMGSCPLECRGGHTAESSYVASSQFLQQCQQWLFPPKMHTARKMSNGTWVL